MARLYLDLLGRIGADKFGRDIASLESAGVIGSLNDDRLVVGSKNRPAGLVDDRSLFDRPHGFPHGFNDVGLGKGHDVGNPLGSGLHSLPEHRANGFFSVSADPPALSLLDPVVSALILNEGVKFNAWPRRLLLELAKDRPPDFVDWDLHGGFHT